MAGVRRTGTVAITVLVLGLVARAQDEKADARTRVKELFDFGKQALDAKDYDASIKYHEEFFPALEKLKDERVSDDLKKAWEKDGRYNYACALSRTGKKEDAIKALARSIELGLHEWEAIEKDDDLEAVREDDDFKKAIAKGKEAELAEMKKSLEGKPLFDFDFEVKTVDGKTLKLSDLKGKVVIVNVWGTWCGPCKKEIPHFMKLRETYKDKGFEVVGLACETKKGAEAEKLVRDYAEKTGIPYPFACVESQGKIVKQISESMSFPTTLFIDRGGKVRFKRVGYEELSSIERPLKVLLDTPAPKD